MTELDALREIANAAEALYRSYASEDAMPRVWIVHDMMLKWSKLARALEHLEDVRAAESSA